MNWLSLIFASLTFSGICAQVEVNVQANWSQVIAISKTTTTLQVVANPLLNSKTCSVADACWKSLQELGADLVRYVPWFPYPKVGVAELDPPDSTTQSTSWDFTDIIPQLYAFMNATAGQGHPVIPNFSTQPTWMYDTTDYSYPSDPNAVDWDYPRGNALPNTTTLLAQYYGRLLSWLVKGEFTDEFGKSYTGGPAYGSRLTHWEVFNEPQGCHGLDPAGYTAQYDAIVTEIRKVADPQHNIKFVGLALSQPVEMNWINYFLNPANHQPGVPLDYISFHWYASPSSRTDPNSFESFFGSIDEFIAQAQAAVDARDKLSPTTQLDADELGVILPNDNDQDVTAPPPIYWNAAGASYAYTFANLAKIGVEVAGESQLVGSPPIPGCDIPNAQYPSVSLLNWTTGAGNARYWVLKLLIDEFTSGDQLVQTSATGPAATPICGVVDGHSGYGTLSLSCATDTATISSIDFAAFGTPTGTCGNYQHSSTCDAKNVTQYVEDACLGYHNCSILSYPTFGDPCDGTYKELIVQAQCSDGKGGYANPSSDPNANALFAQGFISKKIQGSSSCWL